MTVLDFIAGELDIRFVAKTWAELGVDSLDVIALFQAIEEKFRITIDRTEAIMLETPAEVADYVEERCHGPLLRVPTSGLS